MSTDFLACLIAATTGTAPASGWTMIFIETQSHARLGPPHVAAERSAAPPCVVKVDLSRRLVRCQGDYIRPRVAAAPHRAIVRQSPHGAISGSEPRDDVAGVDPSDTDSLCARPPITSTSCSAPTSVCRNAFREIGLMCASRGSRSIRRWASARAAERCPGLSRRLHRVGRFLGGRSGGRLKTRAGWTGPAPDAPSFLR